MAKRPKKPAKPLTDQELSSLRFLAKLEAGYPRKGSVANLLANGCIVSAGRIGQYRVTKEGLQKAALVNA